MPPVMPAAKLSPTLPKITTVPPVIYSPPLESQPSITASAPEFLEELMWKKFSKKIKKIIMTKKIYHFEHGEYVYPITKQLILDGRKNKVLNNKINLKIPIVLFHGTKDEVVPLNLSKKILKICKKSKRKLIKIKNGNHSLSRKSDLKKMCNELNYMLKNI